MNYSNLKKFIDKILNLISGKWVNLKGLNIFSCFDFEHDLPIKRYSISQSLKNVVLKYFRVAINLIANVHLNLGEFFSR